MRPELKGTNDASSEKCVMDSSFRLRIPTERTAVLIGPRGSVKRKIQEIMKIDLIIDSETGEVEIRPRRGMDDPTVPLKVRSVVTAIGRGFPPATALRLTNDDMVLEVLDLREFTGHSAGDMARIKGRIIGRDGRTRRIMEETTDTDISIYGHTVSIMGTVEEVQIAREAIIRLIQGSEHGAVYKYLGRMRHELKKERLKLWEDR
ncbi:MAG: KH domain-containing protein [Candidatus Bathyarchaeia archaeon]